MPLLHCHIADALSSVQVQSGIYIAGDAHNTLHPVEQVVAITRVISLALAYQLGMTGLKPAPSDAR